MNILANQSRAIFLEAIELQSPVQRAEFVAKACAEEPELRAQVERLLRSRELLGSFQGDVPAPTVAFDQLCLEKVGTHIGPYKLLEQIGEGGMGVVYVAQQNKPLQRRVALKIIKPGMDSRQVIARFEAERQTLAIMDHPNIAKVLDAGTTEAGLPYFVMELVKGSSIIDYCDSHKLHTRERLKLFVTLCNAIHHAHQKGIIHRDIKPSNVLVEVHDVAPVLKVIDFGVAKAVGQQLSDKTLHTGFDQIIGTPLYMSPEQFSRSSIDIDTRSDVYSLGVLLYELLTGSTPFESETLRTAGYDEMRRMICHVEPPRPSTRISTLEAAALSTVSDRRQAEPRKLCHQLRGELDWIVMKALEKDRSRRYESAIAFSDDITRFLHDEPVQAFPPSHAYRLKKFMKRNYASLATMALVSIALMAGTIVSGLQAFRATRAEQQSDVRYKQARTAAQLARKAVDKMYTGFAEEWLAQQPKLSAVQNDFLKEALAFYQEFSKEQGSDPQIMHATVLALQRVGAIQKSLGDLEAAERAFVESVEKCRQLIRKYPDQHESHLEMAMGRLKLAGIYRDSGRTNNATEEADRAHEILTRLNTTLFSDLANRCRFAKALDNLCIELTQAHRLLEAVSAVESAFEIWKSLIEESPDSTEYSIGLAENHYARCLQYVWWADRDERAEMVLREAESYLMKLQQNRPNDIRIQPMLSNVLAHLGVILFRANRFEDAEEVYGRAVNLMKKQVEDFPDRTDYQGSLANFLYQLGALKLKKGQLSESEQYSRSALDVYQGLADHQLDVIEYEVLFGSSLKQLIDGLTKQGRYKEARHEFFQSLRRSKKGLNAGRFHKLFFSVSLTIQKDDAGRCVVFDFATDNVGNIYMTGGFWGIVDFDDVATHPGDIDILTSQGGSDAFVAKYAPDLSLVWVQSLGGDFQRARAGNDRQFFGFTDCGRKIVVDAEGTLFVVGEFIGSASFGPTTLSTADDTDGFVIKIDADGIVQWANSLGTSDLSIADGEDRCMGIGVDFAGNVYALRTRMGDGYYVHKFSSTGLAVWSNSIRCNQVFSHGDLAVDIVGNVFMVGSFSGDVDFDPGSETNRVSTGPRVPSWPNEAGFVLKLSTNGQLDWVRAFLGEVVGTTKGYSYSTSITLDESGNVFVGGSYRHTVDFDFGDSTIKLPHIGSRFITKLKDTGELVWARAL